MLYRTPDIVVTRFESTTYSMPEPEFSDKQRKTKAIQRRRKKNTEAQRRSRAKNKVQVPVTTNRIAERSLAGMTLDELAEHFDISVQSVRTHLKKYNEAMLEVGEDVRALHEKHKQEFYPLWKEATVKNLSQAKERTTLQIGDSLGYLPTQEVDPDELMKGHVPLELALELINKMLEHPVMGPQLIQHVQQQTVVMKQEDAEVIDIQDVVVEEIG